MGRREFLAGGITAGAVLLSPGFLRSALAAPALAGAGPYGPLTGPDANGLMLPEGFSGRLIARGGRAVAGTAYPWHFASDGQAVYRTLDGGWILVSNSESPAAAGGGSSAIRFSASGDVTGAHRILAGTNLNCSGGPTPWGTWLSCEEHEGGKVWEADPAGRLAQVPRPALGNLPHEAAAVDPADGSVYLTEDHGAGLFYRFRPATPGDLSSGVLEAAVVAPDNTVTWAVVPDPNLVRSGKRTREQVPQATRFAGGEGLWHHEGVIYFTTKGDRKVWAYDARAATLDVLYDRAAAPDAALDAVDNVTVSPFGDVYVCEDGGNMEICLITPDRVVSPFVRLVGAEHQSSEMCGVVFDPSAQRMYFASQRAFPYVGGTPAADGAVYEVTGPFRLPAGGVPAGWGFGPPAGEREGADLPEPFALRVKQSPSGLRVTLTLAEAATVDVVVRSSDLRKELWHSGGRRPVAVDVAATQVALPRGTNDITLPVPALGVDGAVTAIVRDGDRLSAAARRVRL